MSEQYREDILVSEMTPASELQAQVQACLNSDLQYVNASEVMREMESRLDNGTQYTTFPNRILELEKQKLESAGYIVTRNYVRSEDRYGEGQLYVGFQVALNADAATKAMQMTPNAGTPGESYTKDETDALLANKANNDTIGEPYDPSKEYQDGDYLVVGSDLYVVDSTGTLIPIVEPTTPLYGRKVNLIDLVNQLRAQKINKDAIAQVYDDTATYTDGDYLVVGEELYKVDSTGTEIPGTSLTGTQVNVMAELISLITLNAIRRDPTNGDLYLNDTLLMAYRTQEEYDEIDPKEPLVLYNILEPEPTPTPTPSVQTLGGGNRSLGLTEGTIDIDLDNDKEKEESSDIKEDTEELGVDEFKTDEPEVPEVDERR